MATLAIIAALFILKKRRDAFFLVKGDTSAPLESVRWLGIKEGATWKKAGRISAIVISLGLLTFLVIAGRPPLDIVVRALPFLPAVLRDVECVQRRDDCQGIVFICTGRCGGEKSSALADGGSFWDRSLLRHPLWRDRRVDGGVSRMVVGQIHAGNARSVVGVVYPLCTGCVDLRVCGSWLDCAWGRVAVVSVIWFVARRIQHRMARMK